MLSSPLGTSLVYFGFLSTPTGQDFVTSALVRRAIMKSSVRSFDRRRRYQSAAARQQCGCVVATLVAGNPSGDGGGGAANHRMANHP